MYVCVVWVVLFSPRSWFEVFKETPARELIVANRHTRLFCSKQLLNDVISIRFSDKKLFPLAKLNNSLNDRLQEFAETKNKDVEQNTVFAHSDGDRRRVEIEVYQCDIRRYGSQDRCNLLL